MKWKLDTQVTSLTALICLLNLGHDLLRSVSKAGIHLCDFVCLLLIQKILMYSFCNYLLNLIQDKIAKNKRIDKSVQVNEKIILK